MSASEWGNLLSNPQAIYTLFDEVPDLGSSDLFRLLADERDDSITLGFETYQTPARVKPEWAGREFNSFTFHLVFGGVQELSIRGWTSPAQKSVAAHREADGNLRVVLTSESTTVSFRARTVSISGANVGLVSRCS
ncbi:Imm50 family immunity protein [Streptomyces sp. NPDC056749]|uniref:Imm50 family immunity protein n=1 Tax=Streptomyces sp. NPDC056749 TaxID=3345936 RepID=UPI0036BEA5F0